MLRKILGACVVVFREVILLFTMTIRNLGLLWSRDGLEGHNKMLLFVESCWPFSVFCNGIKEPKHVLQVTYLHHQPPQCSTLPISPLDNVLPKLRNIRRDLCPNHWWNQVGKKWIFILFFFSRDSLSRENIVNIIAKLFIGRDNCVIAQTTFLFGVETRASSQYGT